LLKQLTKKHLLVDEQANSGSFSTLLCSIEDSYSFFLLVKQKDMFISFGVISYVLLYYVLQIIVLL